MVRSSKADGYVTAPAAAGAHRRSAAAAAKLAPLNPSLGLSTRTRQLLFSAVEAILSGVQVILAVVLIVLVLMHSGKDSGLSGAFGVGTGAGPFGGGSLVERNLNRWTIAFALLFVANVVILLKI
jgi:preprotein translocase subunit SecG